ncbi:hypothetical protein AAC387_Pa02g0406 [Persea americana]
MALGIRAVGCTYVVHLLGVVSAALVLVWCIHFRGGLAFEATNKSLIFNMHPVLTLIGFIVFGGEAIISYKTWPLRKEVKKLFHLVLHAVALTLGAIGTYAVFKYHNEKGIANLYSLHSWTGLGTICLYAIQCIFGFIVFFYPGTAESVRGEVRPWHILFGLLVYALAVISTELGFLEKLTFLEKSGLNKYGPEAFLVNFMGLIVLLLGGAVLLSVIAPAHTRDDNFSYTAISDDLA